MGWNALVMFSPASQSSKKFERTYFGPEFSRVKEHISVSLGALLCIKRHLPFLVNFMLHLSKIGRFSVTQKEKQQNSIRVCF